MIKRDVIVIGAGAAGLFCAAQAGQRGKHVEVLDHAKKVGRKILMSGGGRCNFTNMYAAPENYLSQNPHFCKSALSRYTQWDFIGLVNDYKIPYHEKTLGQLFCDNSASDIVEMLLAECEKGGVNVTTRCDITHVDKVEDGFVLQTSQGEYQCESLVIATGGLSLPKLGATPFAYKIAEQFGLRVLPTRAGLVPFTLPPELKTSLAEISGISQTVRASCNDTSFVEDMLITHRGISGPAILQISSYWDGQPVKLDLSVNEDLAEKLKTEKETKPNVLLKNFIATCFARRFADTLVKILNLPNVPLKQLNDKQIQSIADQLHHWRIQPAGTEGYRTAEVTLGGVDTNALSSKTMEARDVEGLFFIGEAVDVTGWLGGYNFQWAWSSGWVAAQFV
ncbi:BaiN/RdsA family NAD(P)/FAD-dependent oxidoreductase [Salinimonas iocasae]|uniref:NAD(P)/FAD-dependent oxidoreductase n=1 Tax=Salinimonas iocasae TaxID=2572577 RepID=A0A5B7Y8Y9_9ALTE|nr:NAD(P)/FAD-dependent oxidoreductase [Salinimonas iocasae]QCZ92082.1 NAD(P)/FAD-dependent oxidoreductase [Salinimonas iocasae]